MNRVSPYRIIDNWLFPILLIATLAPLYFVRHIIGMDVQTHLYNAHIIHDILSGDDWVKGVYELQSFPVPNWTGHAILTFLIHFIGPFWAAKLHLILLLSCLAISFRALAHRLNPEFPFLGSLLGLCLVWSWFTLLGFFNFLWGGVFTFWLMRKWIDWGESGFKLFLGTLLFAALIYFSHPTWLLVASLAGGIWWLIRILRERMYVIGFLLWIAGLLPSWWMLFQFLQRQGAAFTEQSKMSVQELFRMIYDVFPLVVFHGGKEGPWLRLIVIGLLLAAVSYFLFRQAKQLERRNFFWWNGLLSFFFLLSYFVFPDVTSTGSFVSSRLLFLFFVFFFLLLSSAVRRSIWANVGSVVVLVAHFAMVTFYTSSYRNYSAEIETTAQWGERIESGSTAVLVNNDIWFKDNINKALGHRSNVILLDNFEAWTGYFPVVWTAPFNERASVGKGEWLAKSNSSDEQLKAQYVLQTGLSKEHEHWQMNYHLIAREGELSLFKRSAESIWN